MCVYIVKLRLSAKRFLKRGANRTPDQFVRGGGGERGQREGDREVEGCEIWRYRDGVKIEARVRIFIVKSITNELSGLLF